MTTPVDPNQENNVYFVDHESGAEMARLMDQDRLITQGIGGLFSDLSDVSALHRLLDLACGPGSWALEVAYTYPEKEVIGIDISQAMIEYAKAQAQVQHLTNATFRVMDIQKRLDFPDNAFDLVNARFIGFLPKDKWPALMAECLRITRPQGIIRLTEAEPGFTNSPALEQLHHMFTRALSGAGQSFSPHGQTTGTVHMLGRFLRDIHCLSIEQKARVIEYSAGTPFHEGFCRDFAVGFKLVQPFLIKAGVTTEEEVEQAYEQMLIEMREESFCATMFLLTTVGRKP